SFTMDTCALVGGAVATGPQARQWQKHVAHASVGGDEPISLRSIEPPDCTRNLEVTPVHGHHLLGAGLSPLLPHSRHVRRLLCGVSAFHNIPQRPNYDREKHKHVYPTGHALGLS